MRSESRRTPPASRPRSERTGPAAPAPGGGRAALSGDLSQRSVLELQQVLGNQGVAGLIGERPGAPQKLDDGTRREMEARFGEDFSSVEVHDGQDAARQAARRGAEAYTAGERIVFGAGAYDPGSERGRELLGHELAHVVQQRQDGQAAGPSGREDPAARADQARRAEQDAERAGERARDGEQAEVAERAPAGLVQAREAPLASTELSEEAAEVVGRIKDAAGEKWRDFEEWWDQHQESALARIEAEEEGGEEFSQVTQALELELQDTFRETGDAMSRAAGQMREVNPEGAKQLTLLATLLQGNAYLLDRDAKGIGKLLETIRLFFSFKQIEQSAERLRRIHVTDAPLRAGVLFDRLLGDLAALGDRVPGGVADQARMLQDVNRSGGFFREAEGVSAPEDEEYRQMWEEFRKLD